jgi:hypothetical protein
LLHVLIGEEIARRKLFNWRIKNGKLDKKLFQKFEKIFNDEKKEEGFGKI